MDLERKGLQIGVDQVALLEELSIGKKARLTVSQGAPYQEGHENKTDPCSNRDRTDCRDIPRYAGVVASPTEPENTDDKGWASNHGTIKSVLGWRESFPFPNQVWIMCRHAIVDGSPQGGTDPDSYKNKTVFRTGEAAPCHEYDGESLEHCKGRSEGK